MLLRLIRQLFRDRNRPHTAARLTGDSVEDTGYRSSPRAWLKRGEALEAAGDLSGAIDCYRACAHAWPSDLDARLALANALADAWRVEECISAFAEALSVAPRNTEVFSGLLLYSHYAAQVDARTLCDLHRDYGRLLSRLVPAPSGEPYENTANPDRLLRIGYVSRNFSLHSVGYFFEPVIAGHTRECYRVYCYYTHAQADETTQRISRLADVWRHMPAANADVLAQRIREDGIDILVDLEGHTKLNHLATFAHRAAPVQMTWLGYPDTTGLEAIDYRITDAIADRPPLADTRHSERLLRVGPPFLCYRPPDDSPPVAPRHVEGPVVFGSCNVLQKVNPPLITLWAQILKAVPGSRLLLKSRLLQNGDVVDRVLHHFGAEGVGPERLELRGWTSHRVDHLSTYDEIDIALDTYPYNGTTTTCEALWMGVPVITLAGDVHMSRVGASLLSAAGLEDLVTSRAEDYVQTAAALARDSVRRHALRRTMRERLQASPLLDRARFVEGLEAGLRLAWRTWCESQGARAATPGGSNRGTSQEDRQCR